MSTDQLFVTLIIIGAFAWLLGSSRSKGMANAKGGISVLHSLPSYYGSYTALWTVIPSFLLIVVWIAAESSVVTSMVLANLPEHILASDPIQMKLQYGQISNLASAALSSEGIAPELLEAAAYLNATSKSSSMLLMALALILSFAGLIFALTRIDPEFRARNKVEKAVNIFLLLCASIAIITTIGIVLSVLFESLKFFGSVPIFDFMFGTHWSPQTAIRPDQVGSSGSFGAIPLFTGTLLISCIALLIAVPTGLMTAMYLGEYAHPRTRNLVKPLIEMLAGIPTVVYGFVAAITVAPVIRMFGESIGLSVSSESALAAGLVMGVMIIPFVSSLSDDVINAVPQSLRDGALALGATKSEMVRQIVFPAALPGIMGAILLAASRAIGETMIVVMAAGLAAKLTANPLEAVTTITVQIVTLLTGDQEFDSPKTLAAFALGLMLFLTTLALNFYALYVVKKYSERYD